MQSTEPTVPAQVSAGRRRAEPHGAISRIRHRSTLGVTVWRRAIWAVVVALDFFWLSNPVVVTPFETSVRRATIATLVGVILTIPWMRAPRPGWSVVAALSYGLCSTVWSTNIGATAHFASIYALIAGLATLIVASSDARTIAQGMTFGGVLVLGVSTWALREDLSGAIVPPGTVGHLAGVGGNRNVLAYCMALALMFGVSLMPRSWPGRLVWLAIVGTVATGVYLAQSGTGYVAALVIVITAAALMVADSKRRPKLSTRQRWFMRALLLLVPLSGALGVEFIGRALGRQTSTLSGRVPLWEAIWTSTTGANRWFGSGWGAVWPHSWNPATDPPAYLAIINTIQMRLYHGHNSFFDLLPEVGILGVTAFALLYVHAIRNGFRLRSRIPATPTRLEASRTTMLGVLGLLIFGLTEPMTTIPLGWFTIVMLATGLVPQPPPAEIIPPQEHRATT